MGSSIRSYNLVCWWSEGDNCLHCLNEWVAIGLRAGTCSSGCLLREALFVFNSTTTTTTNNNTNNNDDNSSNNNDKTNNNTIAYRKHPVRRLQRVHLALRHDEGHAKNMCMCTCVYICIYIYIYIYIHIYSHIW